MHEPPLAVLLWATGDYEGMIAEEFGWDADGNYVIKMVEGYSWSDGSGMTADDSDGDLQHIPIARRRRLGQAMSGIEKVDDYYGQICHGCAHPAWRSVSS